MEPRRRFRFIKELSEGAFGKVYLAEMITGDNFKSVVAIKLLHGKWTTHQEIVQRSRDEARVLGLLHHRNIIRVEDLTAIQGQCAIVMEYLDGVDIKTLVNDARERGARIPRKVVFEVGSQIASALDAAYNKQPLQGGEPLRLIHRDIKPSNVMLTVAGDVKVLDFGTAQARFDDREAHTQALAFGSAAYMAPERLLGDPDNPAGDVFSLGITLYEMLALDGYGKIHIREERFETKLDKRLNELDLSDLSDERAEQVRMTMRLMLGYDTEQRPSAGEVTELLEALAEEVHDGSIRRFCREVVRPIRENWSPKQDPNDPYTGSTVFEDSSGFTVREGETGETTPAPDLGDPSEALPPPPPPAGGVVDPGDSGAFGARPVAPAPVGQSSGGFPLPPPPPAGVATATPGGDGIEIAPVVPDPGGAGGGAQPGMPLPNLFTAPTIQHNPAGGDIPADLLGRPRSPATSAPRPVASAGPALRPGQSPFGSVPDPTASGPMPSAGNVATGQGGVSAPRARPSPSPTPMGPKTSPPPAASKPPPAASKPPTPRPVANTAQARKPPAPRTPPPPSGGSGGMGKIIGLVVGLLVVVGGGAGAAIGLGLVGGDDGGSTAPSGNGPAPKVEGRGAGKVEVGPLSDSTGTVILRVRPPGQASVRISAVGGDFKETWNGGGALELIGLEAGTYRTKISPTGGSALRATFDVKGGQACELTFDTKKSGEWTVGKCAAAQ